VVHRRLQLHPPIHPFPQFRVTFDLWVPGPTQTMLHPRHFRPPTCRSVYTYCRIWISLIAERRPDPREAPGTGDNHVLQKVLRRPFAKERLPETGSSDAHPRAPPVFGIGRPLGSKTRGAVIARAHLGASLASPQDKGLLNVRVAIWSAKQAAEKRFRRPGPPFLRVFPSRNQPRRRWGPAQPDREARRRKGQA